MWWRAGIIVLAGVAAMGPLPPALVDRWYSGWLFPLFQPPVTSAANRFPFALFDFVLAGLAVALLLIVAGVATSWSTGRGRALGRGAVAALVTAAGVYLWFWAVWGVNYRRTPLDDRLARVTARSQDDAVLALANRAVAELNRLRDAAHAEGFASVPHQDAGLRAAFAASVRALGQTAHVEPGRLKASILGPYFRWAGVDGMISPFTLEVLANPDLLPFERPFVAAHEWGHLAGFGDEAEASFVGWVTCMHGDTPTRYSGWLFLLWQTRAEVAPAVRARLDRDLGPGPRADMAAVAERLTRTKPQVRRVSWAAYDSYLKANRVDEGVRSYSRVLALLARTRFDERWTPELVDRR
jgi:hypothetical protein